MNKNLSRFSSFLLMTIIVCCITFLSSCGSKKFTENDQLITCYSRFDSNSTIQLNLVANENIETADDKSVWFKTTSSLETIKDSIDSKYVYNNTDTILRLKNDGYFYTIEYLGKEDGANKYILSNEVAALNINNSFYSIPFPKDIAKVITQNPVSLTSEKISFLKNYYKECKNVEFSDDKTCVISNAINKDTSDKKIIIVFESNSFSYTLE